MTSAGGSTTGGVADAVIAPTNAEEFVAFTRFAEAPYGHDVGAEVVEAWRGLVDYERFVAARLDGTIIGTAGAMARQLSLPGGATAPCAAITAVAVRPDHRRRGLLRRLMGRLLDDARERGEPFAVLVASEQSIYGRFGFGLAIPTLDLAIERPWANLRDLTDRVESEPPVEMTDLGDAPQQLAPIREALRARRHGLLSRPAAEWRVTIEVDPADERAGAGPRQAAVVRDRGYVIWRIKPDWGATGPAGTVVVEALVGLDPAATAALWRFVLTMDLCSTIEAKARPLDDPLPALVADPGRVRRTAGVPYFLRLLDVATALESRRYQADGVLELEVADGALPDQRGVYRLEVDDGVGTVRRVDQPRVDGVDRVRLDVEDLGALYLGGVRVAQLAAAGRVIAAEGAMERCDRMFTTSMAPWHDCEF